MGKRILSYILAILKLILYFVLAGAILIGFIMLVVKFNIIAVIVGILEIVIVSIIFIGGIITMADDIYNKLNKGK